MKIFGQPAIHEGETVEPTPVGEMCVLCDEPIADGDRGGWMASGEPFHQECMYRSATGGIGHLEDHAYWCGQMGDPDGGRSRRQSALEVWEWPHLGGRFVRRDGTASDRYREEGP